MKSPSKCQTKYKNYIFKWYKGTGFKKYKIEIYQNTCKLKTIQFGDKRYEQYKDSSPLKLYSNQNHLDKDRRHNYKMRHEGNRHIELSAGWFSDKYLW